MQKKQGNRGMPISIYLGDRRLSDKRRAVLQKFAKADNRSVSEIIWLGFLNGISETLRSALQAEEEN